MRRPLRRRQGESIVPLIDVAFFLLVFFLLVGRFDATAPFDLSPPLADTALDLPAGGAMLSLTAAGELGLQRQAVAPARALEAIRARLADDPDYRIRLEADRDAPLRHLLPLVAALEEEGVRDLVLVVVRGAG